MIDPQLLTACAVIIAFILQQWDARRKAKALAVKTEAVAAQVEEKVTTAVVVADTKLVEADKKLDMIHVLVNSQMKEALERIQSLEESLGLSPGQEIDP